MAGRSWVIHNLFTPVAISRRKPRGSSATRDPCTGRATTPPTIARRGICSAPAMERSASRRNGRRAAFAAALCGLALLAVGVVNARDIVLYNPSPSVPAGFYLRGSAEIARGAFVTVRAIDAAPAEAAARAFTDAGDRFIKRVAAIAGDEVCAGGAEVSINGVVAARRHERDGAGRALPTWSGCRVLAGDEILLLGDTPDSFDGRYWGPISRRRIEGVWRPLAR